MLLSMITATWNRSDHIEKLYMSLEEQEFDRDEFEWIVVDDGSEDNTREVIEEIIKKSSIRILYKKQENGGKHRAVNSGINLSSGTWIFTQDSDDLIVSGGLNNAFNLLKKFNSNEEVNAIITPRKSRENKRTMELEIENPINYFHWEKIFKSRESCIMLRKSFLGDVRFQEYSGEKFISESSLYSHLFKDGGIVVSNKIIAAGEYIEGGLTDKSLQLRVSNPIGAAYTYSSHAENSRSFSKYLRSRINFSRFIWHAKFQRKHIPEHLKKRFDYLSMAGIALSLIDLTRAK